MNITETSFKILLFNSKASSFTFWNPKFKTRAQKKKTCHIYLGTVAVPSENAHEAALLIDKASRNMTQNKTIKDFDLNSAAFYGLIMSMNDSTGGGRIAFQLMDSSCSIDNPNMGVLRYHGIDW